MLPLPRWRGLTAVLLVCLFGAATPTASAGVLIVNGGFEAGFTGWTRADQLGSEGMFFLHSGTTSPVVMDPVQAPVQGMFAAMSDAQGPGTHVLYQDFVVPALPIGEATLRLALFVANRATAFAVPSPATLDFSTPALNQQARVDILRAGSDPFSVAAADVLLNVFQTQVGDPLISGYTTITRDVSALLTANAGQTLRLRFAEVDNVFTFQLGVDNVDLTTVPEPSSLALLGIGAVVGSVYYRRRKAGRAVR